MWPLLALGSAFFVAIKDTFAKSLLNRKVRPTQMIFEDAFLYSLFTLALFFYLITFKISFQNTILFLGKTAVFLSAFALFYSLLKKTEVSTLLPFTNLSPIILVILSYLFLSEIISYIQLIGIIIIVLATFSLEITIKHHDKRNPHKHHFGLFKKINSVFIIKVFLLLLCLSFAAILDKTILNRGVNVYTNIFFTYGTILTVMGIYLLFKKLLLPTIKEMVSRPEIALHGMFGMISSYLILFAISWPGAFVSLVIPLRRTSTLMGSVFGGLLFHEKHLKNKLTSITFMIIGIFLIAL